MADFLKILKGEQLVQISNDFDYVSATENFIGLKLMPMVRTENMKVAMYNLLKGSEIPVIALVHALDSEARIGDRPNFEEFKEFAVAAKEAQKQFKLIKALFILQSHAEDEYNFITGINEEVLKELIRVMKKVNIYMCMYHFQFQKMK